MHWKNKVWAYFTCSARLDKPILRVFYNLKLFCIPFFHHFPFNMTFTCCMFQAIIQGLRESGVFSSIITSAPTSLSKDKFFSSIESSNSSRAVASQSLPSRKIGRSRESKATARKALEISDIATYEVAVPPLSPPGMDKDIISEA